MVQEWPTFGQQKQHIYTTPMITKDEEEQKDVNVDKEWQSDKK